MSNPARLHPTSINAGIAATILAILAAAALTAGLVLAMIHHSAIVGTIFLAILTILAGAVGSTLALFIVTMAAWHTVGQHAAEWSQTNRQQETTTPEDLIRRKKVLTAIIITLAATAAATGLGGIATLIVWSIRENLETLGITGLAGLTGLCLGTTIGAMICIASAWATVEQEYSNAARG